MNIFKYSKYYQQKFNYYLFEYFNNIPFTLEDYMYCLSLRFKENEFCEKYKKSASILFIIVH